MEVETVIDDDQKVAQIEEAMIAAGESTGIKVQEDYFGFDSARRCLLPDGTSWIDHEIFNEGKRRQYLNLINRDLTIKKQTQDAVMRMAPGDERLALLQIAIVGWNLVREGKPVRFDKGTLNEFLAKTNPKIIDIIEKDVRLANPWLLAEMSIEDIDRELESLQELRAKKVEEEEANLGSASK